MLRILIDFIKPTCLAVGIFFALLLSVSGLPASSTTSAVALQHCPAVEDEIIDLEMLAEALRGSNAVSFMKKIRLKSSIDELLKRLNAYHDGHRKYSLEQLEEQYNVLLMRIASHIQHKDLILHQQLCNAWQIIWLDLEDSGRFNEKFSG